MKIRASTKPRCQSDIVKHIVNPNIYYV